MAGATVVNPGERPAVCLPLFELKAVRPVKG